MAFISDKFVPSGSYVITNAKHQLSIICSEEKDTDDNLNDFKVCGLTLCLPFKSSFEQVFLVEDYPTSTEKMDDPKPL